jgi:hypothetical protein
MIHEQYAQTHADTDYLIIPHRVFFSVEPTSHRKTGTDSDGQAAVEEETVDQGQDVRW